MARKLKRILLLEDVESNANLIRFALEEIADFEVTHARDAADAIESFKAAAFDLCLFDHLMPGMTGLDAMLAIRDTPSGRDVPVVFLTARSDICNWKKLKASGAQAVIAKPFDIMLLGSMLLDVFHACDGCETRGGVENVSTPSWAEAPSRSALARRMIRESQRG